jgi:hypothetical protein
MDSQSDEQRHLGPNGNPVIKADSRNNILEPAFFMSILNPSCEGLTSAGDWHIVLVYKTYWKEGNSYESINGSYRRHQWLWNQ